MKRTVITVIGLALLLAGCGYDEDGVDAFGWTNTGDPRIGKVEVNDGYSYKVCDGTTLLYGGATEAAVIDSPECQP
jgi:hypothetical protein